MVIPCKSKKKGMMVKLVASYSRESFKEIKRKGGNGLNTVDIEQDELRIHSKMWNVYYAEAQ